MSLLKMSMIIPSTSSPPAVSFNPWKRRFALREYCSSPSSFVSKVFTVFSSSSIQASRCLIAVASLSI